MSHGESPEKERDRLVEQLGLLEREQALLARSISHDLRQPLHVISGYVELLSYKYGSVLDPRGQQLVERAMSGVQRMNGMIDALVGLMRLDQRAAMSEAVDLEQVWAAAVAGEQELIDQTGAVVTSDPLPSVSGQPAALQLLFTQLLRNALTFRGDQPPRIHLSGRAQSSGWRFELRDNGRGIDPRLHSSIFEPFQRGQHTLDGYGMGLAISSRVVALHGGQLGVDSSLGSGAVFWFTLDPERFPVRV